MKATRVLKYYTLRIKRYRGSPHSIAGGLAVGVFIGLTPTMPLHTLLIALICFVTRTSVIIAVAISWLVCNPLTYLPIYYFAALIGNRITPYSLQMNKVTTLIEQFQVERPFSEILSMLFDAGYEAAVVMLVGGFVLAIPAGILTYYICLPFVIFIKNKKTAKQSLL